MEHVQQIFQKLQKNGLQLDIDKFEFFIKKIKYLNLIITPENIKMDQENFQLFLIGQCLKIWKLFRVA